MRVLAYDIQAHPEIERLGGRYLPIEEVLAQSDFVSVHLPLLPATQGVLGREMLGLMKPTAFLINTARGEIVNDEALYEALTTGKLAGAATDVYAVEPPARSALLELDNVISTPHASANTALATRRMADQAADNLLAVLRGERPAAVVNPEVYLPGSGEPGEPGKGR